MESARFVTQIEHKILRFPGPWPFLTPWSSACHGFLQIPTQSQKPPSIFQTKVTESNSSGLMVDSSLFQIHSRSGENKHPATACAEAPPGRADAGRARLRLRSPLNHSSCWLAKCHPLTSRMGDPCLPEGGREGSSTTEQTLGLHAGNRRSELRIAGLLSAPSSRPASKESLTVQV